MLNIKVVDGCHIWQRCVNSDGYPRMTVDGNNNIKVHRYVYEKCKGDIPKGYVVRHTCDNILCVNPDHLIVGTQQDNVQDRVDRGRSYNHVSEQDMEDVKELRQWGSTYKEISVILGINIKRVEYINNKIKKSS